MDPRHARDLSPVDVTEMVIHYHRHGFPKKVWTAAGRLFQARMWREYAQMHDGLAPSHWSSTRWVAWPPPERWASEILRVSKAECLRRARVNLYLARRINRHARRLTAETLH